MNFKRINNITGWIVCLIACTVYILTAEAAGSLWDCGEFVSSCFKVQIPHPPGAPLFVLIGRLFIILFGGNPSTAAKGVNIMSALASGFTILFLFWSITHFARKIVQKGDKLKTFTKGELWSIMGAGAVGALAYTFSDSFWYSAVEGEVYALSSFFTALVFWAMLKWENQADEPGADRWIVFIFFMIGLSIGVHLLSLLNIPAIVMIYYFRRKDSFNYAKLRSYFIWIVLIGGVLGAILAYIGASGEVNAERGIVSVDGTVATLVFFGSLIAIALLFLVERANKAKKTYYGGIYIFFVIACAITGIVQVAVIQYSVKVAGYFDIFFVNSVGMPYFSGFIIFFVLLAIGIWLGLRFANKKGWGYLRLSLWCLTFILLGYSTYITTMIRSNADPAVDMYNVDNPMSLVGYLGRDQYGDFPLLYGQKFNAQPIDYKEGTTKYEKGKDKYVAIGKDGHYVYAAEDKMVFPRMWDASNDQAHADYYAYFMGIGKNKDGSYERGPEFGDNLRFFLEYQNYFMYMRYFFWNFAGKQNDVQGVFDGNPRDGNWITGIDFIDSIFYGDQSQMPDSLKENKAHNKLFALPLILGLIGLFFHFKRKGDDALVTFLLFFFTGFAIVIYLNQPGYQPRERDYAYVGSFYAFAIWIGLGVLKVQEWLAKKVNQTTAATIATVVCLLAVPVIMAQQEWNDHDRSKKLLAPDLAKDYLESCAPNAILFTFGDNDTYPLWYAQEVEGVRPDIRVINTSLLGIDWYINQLRYKVNQSDPIDVIVSAAQIEGRKRDYVMSRGSVENSITRGEVNQADATKVRDLLAKIDGNRYYDLYDVMKNFIANDAYTFSRGEDEMSFYPVSKFSVPVDVNVVKQNKTVNPEDSVLTELHIDLPARGGLMKNDLAVLTIIAANKWKRPIYFTNQYGELGFGQYLRKDGLTYRLVPLVNSYINTDYMKDKLMTKFRSGNADVPGVYFDEENRRHLNTIRRAYTELSLDLSFKNRKEEARQVLNKADKMMDPGNFPYAMVSRGNEHNRLSMMFLEAAYRAEDKALSAKVLAALRKDLQQQLRYLNSLTGKKAENMEYDKNSVQGMLRDLDALEQNYSGKKPKTPETGVILGGDSGLPAAVDSAKP
ncbi:protein O-mannosyl-transferase family [Deminuibacter soli]|uniref:protein O-mannosyl-transferase family n=1 Tax=Deminuibacter soli TaxID=2291815 RepID=UPI001FE34CA9|nr:DUF2723 domain-containing protein [Deminuibacter soli]